MTLFKGVTRNKNTRKFEACVWLAHAAPASVGGRSRGRQLYCGSYDTVEEAVDAHDQVVLALHGTGDHKTLNYHATHEQAAVFFAEGVASVRSRLIRTGKAAAHTMSTTGYIGVSKKGERFEARCHVGTRQRYFYIGIYDSAQEAARAYDACTLVHRGPYAVTNFDYSEASRHARGSPPVETPPPVEAPPPAAAVPVMRAPQGDETDSSSDEN
jgi:hypothetical protein